MRAPPIPDPPDERLTVVDVFASSRRTRVAFRALAETIVPEAVSLGERDWLEVERIVGDALRQRPPALRRQLALFIRALDTLPTARWGRPFHRLDAKRRTRFLRAVERSRVLLVRRGFWGLRTLVFMGYYGRPDVHARIGYGARLRGWLEHPAAPDAARRRAMAEPVAGPARSIDA